MTLGGGSAFAKRLPFERYFRDARAGMVMGVAHDIAALNVARSIFPKPKEPAIPNMARVGPDGTGATSKDGAPDEKAKPVPPKPVYVDVTVQTAKGVFKYRYQKLPNGDHKYVGVVRPATDDEDPAPTDGKPGEKKPEETGGSKGPFTAS